MKAVLVALPAVVALCYASPLLDFGFIGDDGEETLEVLRSGLEAESKEEPATLEDYSRQCENHVALAAGIIGFMVDRGCKYHPVERAVLEKGFPAILAFASDKLHDFVDVVYSRVASCPRMSADCLDMPENVTRFYDVYGVTAKFGADRCEDDGDRDECVQAHALLEEVVKIPDTFEDGDDTYTCALVTRLAKKVMSDYDLYQKLSKADRQNVAHHWRYRYPKCAKDVHQQRCFAGFDQYFATLFEGKGLLAGQEKLYAGAKPPTPEEVAALTVVAASG